MFVFIGDLELYFILIFHFAFFHAKYNNFFFTAILKKKKKTIKYFIANDVALSVCYRVVRS